MNKNLDLDGALTADIHDLISGQLPGQNHPAAAHFRRLFHTLQIVHRHLGAAVDGHIRSDLADQLAYAQILHDDGIHSCPAGLQNHGGGSLQFPVKHQRVQGEIDFHTPDMAIADTLAELFLCEIFRIHAGIEAAIAQIHRIGAVLYGGNEGITGARGR